MIAFIRAQNVSLLYLGRTLQGLAVGFARIAKSQNELLWVRDVDPRSIVGFFVGSLIAGLGFGPAFTGAYRTLAALAPPDKRSSHLSSIFVILYIAFGVPVIVAGVAVAYYGLIATTYVYGLGVIALAVLTTIMAHRNTSNEDVKRKSLSPY